ncbi:unnamed protein product [Trichobilharzia szidati]|nr:unnamed protein product [Trichobilharzia szidati]
MNSNSNEDNFFSKFGQYEAERARRRVELMQDYLEFKRKEEENFHKRFSDKKKSCSSSSEHSGIPKSTETPSKGNDNTKSNDLGGRLTELEKKINTLLVDKSAASQINPAGFDGEVTGPKEANGKVPFINAALDNEYEADLRKRLQQISEADKRLSLIEEEYNKLKFVDSQYVAQSFNNVNPGSQLVTKPTKDEEMHLRQMQKAQYRRELESQIAEIEEKRLREKMDAVKPSPIHFRPLCTNEVSQFSSNSENSLGKDTTPTESIYFDIGQRDLLVTHIPYSDVPTKKTLSVGNSIIVDAQQIQSTAESKLRKMQYAEELKKQIEEARAKKAQQKKEDEEYNRKIDEQNLTLELSRDNSQMRQKLMSCSSEQLSHKQPLGILDKSKGMNPVKITEIKEVSQPNFARGGHGIFGSPLTEAQKCSLQQYKEELAQQIEEKRCMMEAEKQREIELERRDMERIRIEQMKMQREFEMEQARKLSRAEKPTQQLTARHCECNDKIREDKIPEMKRTHTQTKTTKGSRPTRDSGLRRYSPTGSPKILIGPEASKLNKMKQIDNEATMQHKNDRTQSVLKQLNTLRAQLDVEKSKIESTYYHQKRAYGDDKEPIEIGTCRRAKPRVNRKAVELFQDVPSSNKGSIYRSVYEDELLEMPFKEDLSTVDQKQLALLKKQDDYLQKLRRELEEKAEQKSRTSLIENQNPTTEDQTKLSVPTWNTNDKLTEQKSELNVTLSPHYSSNGSIDLKELAEKNKQRLIRLDAIQLLDKVSNDPESVLQRFVNEHDGMFLNESKHNIF